VRFLEGALREARTLPWQRQTLRFARFFGLSTTIFSEEVLLVHGSIQIGLFPVTR